MIYLIKTWWLVGQLRKLYMIDSALQTTPQALQSGVGTTQARFIEDLARKSLKRFSLILRWRKRVNQKNLNTKVSFYNTIVDNCIRGNKKYIEEFTISGNITTYIHPSFLGFEFSGVFSLFDAILSRYERVWTFILGAGGAVLIWLVIHFLDFIKNIFFS